MAPPVANTRLTDNSTTSAPGARVPKTTGLPEASLDLSSYSPEYDAG